MLKKLILFSLFLTFSVSMCSMLFPLHIGIYLAQAYLFLLTFINFKIAESGVKKDNQTFIKRIYGSMAIRILFGLFPLLLYFIFVKTKDIPLVLCYVVLYLFYTTFEIYLLVSKLRPDLNSKKTP